MFSTWWKKKTICKISKKIGLTYKEIQLNEKHDFRKKIGKNIIKFGVFMSDIIRLQVLVSYGKGKDVPDYQASPSRATTCHDNIGSRACNCLPSIRLKHINKTPSNKTQLVE